MPAMKKQTVNLSFHQAGRGAGSDVAAKFGGLLVSYHVISEEAIHRALSVP